MLALTLVLIVALVGVCAWLQKEPKAHNYRNGSEVHDIETWRKRGMEITKDKNTKSAMKYANETQLLGLLYIAYGWDLTKCK